MTILRENREMPKKSMAATEVTDRTYIGVTRVRARACTAYRGQPVASVAATQPATELIDHWIAQRCRLDPNAACGTRCLYEDWASWAKSYGEYVGTVKRFALALVALGFQRANTSQRRGFRGLTLKRSPGGAGGETAWSADPAQAVRLRAQAELGLTGTCPLPKRPAHPRARSRHHHRLGAAHRRGPDHQRHGVVPPEPLRRRRHALPALHQLADRVRPAERADRDDLVRAVRRHAGTDASHVYGGLMATLTAWAELRGVPYEGVPGRHHQAPRHRQGQCDKEAVMAAVRARGFNPTDDNEADALAILFWALDTQGGIR